jgi:hypothetical protein
MKRSEHPDFFRLPPPEGRSRESTIVLDKEGAFWHDGARVEHAPLAQALHDWIGRHPHDGRYILTNGYDWTYLTVEDVPFIVSATCVTDRAIEIALDDGTVEDWAIGSTTVDAAGRLRVMVKAASPFGAFPAKFSSHAQQSLAPLLHDEGERIVVRTHFGTFPLPAPA